MEITAEVWCVQEEETTTGGKCFVAYDLLREGCMAQGRTPEEAFIELQSARIEYDKP